MAGFCRGILPGHGIGQSEAQWYTRSIPAVKAAFAAVWGTEDLLVSFDGVSIWRPWSRKPEWKTGLGGSWLHIDQHPTGRPGKHCVQGLVNLLPTSEETGGNGVIPGSHHLHEKIPTLYTDRLSRIDKSIDHFRFPKNDPLLADMKPITCHLLPVTCHLSPVTCHLEPGDLMLWDSRTIHCSSPPTNPATKHLNDSELVRAISLICMMPRRKSNATVISRRKAAVENTTSTTNWSDVFVNADKFPDLIAVDPTKYARPSAPVLNDLQLRLVGWTEEEITTLLASHLSTDTEN